MNEENKSVELAAMDSSDIIGNITNASSAMYCSFEIETKEDKKRIFNVISGQTESLKSNLNKTIVLKDVVMVPVELVNQETGEVKTSPRVSLIDEKGVAYTSTSWGIYNSLRKLYAVYGTLHFDEPIKVVPTEVQTKNGFTMNLKLL